MESWFFIKAKTNVYSRILMAFLTFLSLNVKTSACNESLSGLERGLSSQLSSLIRKGSCSFEICRRKPSIYLQLGKWVLRDIPPHQQKVILLCCCCCWPPTPFSEG